MTESTTLNGNERRRAVKKIAVGAAVVGAIAAGAGKLIDISSQSKGSNSPAAQTILTSQGLIPPALTSDPANPVPGQMWYRSDAGVEAHFDAVQNRVVYSSEINDGNVHVTSKGIINGLSVLPNDGTGWFGPDTTKGAKSRGQYGSPYTETSGIQEITDYTATLAPFMPEIHFASGLFTINYPIIFKVSSAPSYFISSNNASISAPSFIGQGEPNGNRNYQPSNTTIKCSDSFPSGEYVILYDLPDTPFSSGATNPQFVGIKFKQVTVDCNGLGAGVAFFSPTESVFEDIVTMNFIAPSPVATLALTTRQQALQTGAFVYSQYSNNAGMCKLTRIRTNSSYSGEDGMVISNLVGSLIIEEPFMYGGATRYGLNLIQANQWSTTIINPQFDLNASQPIWSGAVPSNFPQSANMVFSGGGAWANVFYGASVTIIGNAVYDGARGNQPYIFANSNINVHFIGGAISGNQTNPSSTSAYVVQLYGGGRFTFDNVNIIYNSLYYGVATQLQSVVASTYMFEFNNCSFNDLNTGTNSVDPLTNSSSYIIIKVKNPLQNNTNYTIPSIITPTISLSANPPVSDTVYQNTYPYDIRLKIPVTYSPTSTAAATLATGTSSTSTVTTSTKVSYPAGITTGIINTYEMLVEAGQYFELVATNATIGTVEVQAA